MKSLKSKMIGVAVGGVLILIALILGGIQLWVYDFAKSWGSRHAYVYGLFGIIGLIGIIIVAWAFMMKEASAKPAKPTQPSQ